MRLYEFFDKLTTNKAQLAAMGMAGTQLQNMLGQYRDRMLNKLDVRGMEQREADLFRKMVTDKKLVSFAYHLYNEKIAENPDADRDALIKEVVEASWASLGK